MDSDGQSSETTESSDAEEDPQGSEEVENGSSNDTVEPSASQGGWGSEVESCNSNEQCSDGLLCSNSGECLSTGSSGIGQIGDECNVAEDCGIGLQCVENACAQGVGDTE